MSVLHTNNITNYSGTGGPTIEGISTVDSTGFMKVPVGDTRTRLVKDIENIVTDGLVLHLDAGRAESFGGDGTTWRDLSGNGNNGTLVNGVGFSADDGGSLIFDGVNDRAELDNSEGLDSSISFGEGKSFTIELIFKIYNTSVGQSIIARREFDGSSGTDYMIFYQSNQLTFGTGASSDPGAWRVFNTEFTYTNQIIHFCGVVNSTGNQTGTKITYKDGTEIDSISYTIKTPATANKTFIGKYDGSGFYLNGNIYSVKIYNRALTASEVLQNYEATKGRYL